MRVLTVCVFNLIFGFFLAEAALKQKCTNTACKTEKTCMFCTSCATCHENCAHHDTGSIFDGEYDHCYDPCAKPKGNPANCDEDGDGIIDYEDKCPYDPQNDADDDKYCSTADSCPNDPKKHNEGQCGCGKHDIDWDKLYRSGKPGNAAKGKRITSSSISSGSSIGALTDGKSNGGVYDPSVCFRTEATMLGTSTDSWIKIDLGSIYAVRSVNIVGRNDKPDESSKLKIYVGKNGNDSDEVCATNVDATVASPVRAECPYVLFGRYVRITKQGSAKPSVMTICEIEVESLPNLALNKPVTVSGNSGVITSGATDGNTYGGVYGASSGCVRTESTEKTSWIKVDLEASYGMRAVTVVGRKGFSDESDGLTIRIGEQGDINDPVCAVGVNAAVEGRVRVQCAEALVGRYISVWITNNALTICELEAEPAELHDLRDTNIWKESEVKCSDESGTCSCMGYVRMGYGDSFTPFKKVDGSIECSWRKFGTDPAHGKTKSCFCLADGNPCPPSHPFAEPYSTSKSIFCYSAANNNGEVCSYKEGLVQPPYGYSWGENQQACFYARKKEAISLSNEYKCASQGAKCNCLGHARIRNDETASSLKLVTGSIDCSWAAFGVNPAPSGQPDCYCIADGNPCPPSFPYAEEYSNSKKYFCYAEPGNGGKICSYVANDVPAPAGKSWGLNQAPCRYAESFYGNHNVGDGIPDCEDSCPLDEENDADGDNLCSDVDECPYDKENDSDSDQICGDVDSCAYDGKNDEDSDNICGQVDSCPEDAQNDLDGDKICGGTDTCERDPENDIDSDNVCGDVDDCDADPNKVLEGVCGCGVPDDDTDSDGVFDCNDSCPLDPRNDGDGDGICGDQDSCPLDPENDLDSDALCANEDPCKDHHLNDLDSDNLCEDVDLCDFDSHNDADGDSICADVDICPADALNDPDSDNVCRSDGDECPFDAKKLRPASCGCGNITHPQLETDSDNDGIADCVDSCPNTRSNDRDGDGFCDNGIDDKCPKDKDKHERGVCGCGYPDRGDSDSDGILDCVDSCKFDADNDLDSDNVCGDADACPLDSGKISFGVCGCVEDDDDSDNILNCVDICPDDAKNDEDSDNLCENVDPCPTDAQNDFDGDALCHETDPCPLDIDNDLDSDNDGILNCVDSCPDDAKNDEDNDNLCENDDPCPTDAQNDLDSDGLCSQTDPCPSDPSNNCADASQGSNAIQQALGASDQAWTLIVIFFCVGITVICVAFIVGVVYLAKKKKRRERDANYSTETKESCTEVEFVDEEQNGFEIQKKPFFSPEKTLEPASPEQLHVKVPEGPDEENVSSKALEEGEIFAEIVDEDTSSDDGINMTPDHLTSESGNKTFAV